jgi:His-Xaa-Ser system radical SAM maturase HxsC
MKTLHGKALNINRRIIGRVSRKSRRFGFRRGTVFVPQDADATHRGHVAVLTASETPPAKAPAIFGLSEKEMGCLEDGDIVLLDPDGSVHRVWKARSNSNVVMVTNVCNCQCVMCPQPSCEDEEDHMSANIQMLRLIRADDARNIALSGGEPTLKPDWLCSLLDLCKRRFPSAAVDLLTNGRKLSDFEFARSIAAIQHPHLTYCVALHADVAAVHDDIAGAPNSFKETVEALHNLALLRQRVEIRVVVLRQNYERLPGLAEFIYRNFPFVCHVALMGMETTGLASTNLELIWVDPVEYAPHVRTAVHVLQQRDLRVSIYNLPFCLLPEELWRFARDSISDWKKAYLAQCEGCDARERCPGLFSTSIRQSSSIGPITQQPKGV